MKTRPQNHGISKLKNSGLAHSEINPCLFKLTEKHMHIIVSVNDILISRHDKNIQELINKPKEQYTKLENLEK